MRTLVNGETAYYDERKSTNIYGDFIKFKIAGEKLDYVANQVNLPFSFGVYIRGRGLRKALRDLDYRASQTLGCIFLIVQSSAELIIQNAKRFS